MDEIVVGVTKFYGAALAVIVGAVWLMRRVKGRARTDETRLTEELRLAELGIREVLASRKR